ncbi:MG2 domain-containing protein [Phocaeicola vulgatus]|uniref:alpha-2-macroglobulin family protein n=1 Tax=Phocaeicola vulgatus TaxID=821 RepID=UPI00202E1EAC|nr:alpha-2-macroglobulin family protein [Phocaeicola vulgatus]MCM1725919.1 MG2 domain-containing protein [Phocaeicola vulgatus]MCM1738884.1 MG2 domain-containing protein [Phocaeicola vulgatus]MCM1765208.1 MG2 domain-containing protein [Phocaeicola vulgatus]MCM1783131.1 MG2 domain-containing protein [Phocaeicola vulgatus]MCM1907638.1 MG2 domain-containing protein [Phocaeicola vulgatus]
MKIRYLSLIVLLVMSVFAPMQAQTYDNLWKELEVLERKDLPKSVISEAMKIYDKAKAEQNVPQMMKAYLTAMQYRSLLTPDSLKVDMNGLEQWASQTGSMEDKAILYSILGEMTMPADVKKGLGYLQASLKDKDRLLLIPVEKLRPMVRVGEASKRYFRDNLYNLLARRAIQIMQQYRWQAAAKANQTNSLPADMTDMDQFVTYQFVPVSDCDLTAAVMQTYQSLLKAYDTETEREGWLLTGIDALNYLYRNFSGNFSNDVCQQELRKWIHTYPAVKTVPEAYLALAQFLQYQNNQVERLRIVREGIAGYPRYEGINQLKNIEKEILNASLSLEIATAYPGEQQSVKVNYKNLTGITLQLYKVNLPVTSAVLQNRTTHFESKYARLQREEHFSLKPTTDYLNVDTTLTIQAPQAGIYFLKAVPDGKKGVSDGTLMNVTALKTIYRPLPDGTLELVVVDAVSGQPVSEAEVTIYTEKGGGYSPQQTYQADKQGTLKLDFLNSNKYWYNAHTAADNAMPILNLWKNDYYYKESKRKEVLQLFTDRSIYRPGQTVYVSGLAYEMEKDSTRVLADKKYTVSLYDANNNETGKVEVRTNGFGSFSGQFVLPSPCLTGYFSLRAADTSVSFKVEEYKRPTFDVTFEPVKVEYQVGDSIEVVGMAKTFAGAPVQNARVHYNISRSYAWVWRFMGRGSARWEGEAMTDADGKFSVPVHFEIDSDRRESPLWYYTYNIQADVTDGAGETQQANLSLPLGSTSMVLNMDNLPDNLVKEKKLEIKLTAMNLSGEPVDTPVTYQVVEMEEQKDGQEKEGRKVLTGTVEANKSFVPEAIYALPSGNYRLKLSAKDTQGRECTASKNFLLFSLNDKRPPFVITDWFYQDGLEFDAASPATVYIGSSEKNVYLLYDVFAGNKRLESKRIELSDSVVSFRFPYKKEYGDGILVSMAFVKDGRLYSHNARIMKPAPEKKLQLKWTTFRDKLRPGQQEEWKLTVLYPDGSPAEAEMLATMYDASLDKIYSAHKLDFGVDFHYVVPLTYWNTSYMRNAYLYVDFPLKRLRAVPLEYSELIIPSTGRMEAMVVGYGGSPRATLAGALKIRGRSAANAVMNQEAVTDMVLQEEMVETSAQEKVEMGSSEELAETGDIQIRENFAETAFFYPQLRTNEKGEVSISFVLPESLTRWKFMGLAHTRNVDYGKIEATATASKEFMLQPNMPRFVRVGDKANIAASLMNLSDKGVKGTVRMELFNPETEKVFYSQKQKFDVKGGETGHVNFTFEVSDKYAVMACRMVADGDTFSDGEQRYIPVLTDKQWVTETVPLNVNGEGAHTFSLENLFNKHSKTASEQRLTVEFTAHPAWYAVQALPVVAHPQNEDALSWATAYYAHSLAAYIVKENPRIKQVFDSWKAQGGTKETFMSNLQKNQELKNILLAETPWLAEATNEAEQKQRIATLFDLNTMNSQLAVSVEKLGELQNADGAWSWYKGMQGSRYVTTQVMEMLVRLNALTHQDADSRMQPMIQKGFEYLGKQAAEEYKSMKEAEKKGAVGIRPSEQVLRYLYICALDGKAPVDEKVNRYFIDKLSGEGKELTIYGKALGAIILQQSGKVAEARLFMQSLMEYSVVTDEMGRYFDTPKARYSWFSYKIPTEVAAMEAIQRITKDTKAIDEMKRWLLKQKQTQTWETPIATADAVYALMATGASDLLTNTGGVEITLGKEVIRTPADDAIGYIKKTVSGDVMNIKKVRVDKEGAGMGWGAVYAQYLESMDQIGEQGNGLSVSRQLYKGDEALNESVPLKVGDKITVRLTVKADRDMDFVQIKDDRAACMEPLQAVSGFRWGNGLGYYQATKDASTQFFIDQMRKGTYVIEYQVYVNRTGEYQAGIATVQSAYAPEFGGHTGGYRVMVE